MQRYDFYHDPIADCQCEMEPSNLNIGGYFESEEVEPIIAKLEAENKKLKKIIYNNIKLSPAFRKYFDDEIDFDEWLKIKLEDK